MAAGNTWLVGKHHPLVFRAPPNFTRALPSKGLPLFSNPRTNIQRSCIIRRFLRRVQWKLWNTVEHLVMHRKTEDWHVVFHLWWRLPQKNETSDCVFLSLTVRTNMVSQAAERPWPHSKHSARPWTLVAHSLCVSILMCICKCRYHAISYNHTLLLINPKSNPNPTIHLSIHVSVYIC